MGITVNSGLAKTPALQKETSKGKDVSEKSSRDNLPT